MKRKLTLSVVALLIGVLGIQAQSFVRLPQHNSTISNIEVSNGIDLTLVPVDSYDGMVKLSGPECSKVSVTVNGNTLVIKGKRGWLFSKRVPVYVGVKQITSITASNDVRVFTDGVLDAPVINVFMDGSTRMSLATRGDIQVYTTSDNDVKLERKTIGKGSTLKAEVHIQDI
jgi:Putative auto-transporter adhesin, head GIN domain